MKPLMTILGLALILLSCEKDPEINALPGNDLPSLHLSAYKDFLPYTLLTSSARAVFVNEKGVEKEFILSNKEGVQNQALQGLHYDADYFDVRYTDGHDQSYSPLITAYSRYYNLEHAQEFVSALIQTDANNGYFPTIILCTQNDCPYLQKNLDSMVIANHTFHNVVTNYPATQFTSFTQVYYSLTLGIVAFRGKEGEMWALDRFE